MKIESGQLRELLEVNDCRNPFFLHRFPTLYFEAAFDVRWIRATKIIKVGETPGQDRLAIGIIAAEELTKEEFEKRAEVQISQSLLNQAKEIINPQD